MLSAWNCYSVTSDPCFRAFTSLQREHLQHATKHSRHPDTCTRTVGGRAQQIKKNNCVSQFVSNLRLQSSGSSTNHCSDGLISADGDSGIQKSSVCAEKHVCRDSGPTDGARLTIPCHRLSWLVHCELARNNFTHLLHMFSILSANEKVAYTYTYIYIDIFVLFFLNSCGAS